ncbi:HBL/NHE enterotoxin family protein [Bacillus toyonensis]|uniref:HBL/NHE enterotoxin family protein n=1 Tax=Bacillus toyonensis TaxID=155322 RepID=UPI000BF2501A|nr:HBL/NHE enterotoxin family protein [Bacillus toyonensis]PGC84458.1 hypothetical protein COM39_25655 [Bacillus toyonensis]
MKKCIIAGVTATALLASGLPLQTFAATTTPQTVQNMQAESSKFAKNLPELGSQSILLQTYALTLLKQGNVVLPELPNFVQHQETARKNARYVLDKIYPNFISTNQNIISFGQKFKNYYTILSNLAAKAKTDPQAKKDFLSGIQSLQSVLIKNKGEIDKVTQQMGSFQTILAADVTNFSTEAKKAEDLLISKNGQVKELSDKIKTINADIQSQITTITTTSIAIAVGAGALAIGILIGTATIAAAAAPTISAATAITSAGLTLATPAAALAGGSVAGGITAGVGATATGGLSTAATLGLITPIVTGLGAIIGGSVTLGLADKKLTALRNDLMETTQKLGEATIAAAALTIVKGQIDQFTNTVAQGKASFDTMKQGWEELNGNFTDMYSTMNQVDVNQYLVLDKLNAIKGTVEKLEQEARTQEKILTNVK